MRTRSFVGFLALSSLVASAALYACTSSPAVTVIRVGPGSPPPAVQGDPVKLRRPSQETYVGIQPGYYVVRSHEDWRAVWRDGKEPPLPATLDMSTTMLLLGVAEGKDAIGVKFTRAVETAGAVHVYVRETTRGEGCVARPTDRIPHEAIFAARVDKPVKFYVDEERAEACGDVPLVDTRCRRADAQTWATKLEAQPGDTIDCEMRADSRGRFAVVDRALLLNDLPAGSTAKLAYDHGPVRATFRVDVFGAYRVRGEATDEGGRRAEGSVTVQAAPPKSKDVVAQLVWSGFDVSDDPDTFPRLVLSAKAGPRECSLDKQPPDLCEVKRFSAYTVMKLRSSSEHVPLTIRYVDERIEKGPRACVQLWFDGARTAETCDLKHRDADERWDVGTIDMQTGTFVDAMAALMDAGAEAGADAAAPSAPKKKR